MKIKQLLFVGGALLLGLSSQSAQAVPALVDLAFNIDGSVSIPTLGDPVPAEVDMGGFNTINGLGTITASISSAGTHYFGAFFDHEIDEPVNSFFNEVGGTSGIAMAGQSWEIDEPGFGSVLNNGSSGLPYVGDIFDNFSAGNLDNQIFHDAFDDQDLTTPDDVSLAMGWDFTLALGETATITLLLSEIMPTSGFFLSHTDPDSVESLYLSSRLDIMRIPEPPLLYLLGIGLAGLVVIRRRIRGAV